MDTLAQYRQLSLDLEKQLENLNDQIKTVSEMKALVDQTIAGLEQKRNESTQDTND